MITDSLFREKSYGTSPSNSLPAARGRRARMAASMGLANPVWRPAFRLARPRTSSESSPHTSRTRLSCGEPTVSVPVLSVHRMLIEPRFSITCRRLTMTFRLAISRAPDDSPIVTMAGSICGVSPTARASENSSASSSGRPNNVLTTKMNAVSTSIIRTSR